MSQTKSVQSRRQPWADVLKGRLTVRDWRWWKLPPLPRWYVAGIVVAAVGIIAGSAVTADWRPADLEKFLVLIACGVVYVASTPRSVDGQQGGMTVDFSTAWVLPVAILLPSLYAAVSPFILVALKHWLVRRGILHRYVFTAASISVSYVAAGGFFRLFPASFAGPSLGTGNHAFTWTVAVAAAEFLGWQVQRFLVVIAVKMSDPSLCIWPAELTRDRLLELVVGTNLAVVSTVEVALSLKLVAVALPTALLGRRFLVHPGLVARSRLDGKTGLLNSSTWRSEAEAELARVLRNGQPLALILIDVDHFKRVNDTYGHLVGDQVLQAIADALAGQSRSSDRLGRFGGEEYVLLLARTSEEGACKIAERIRAYIAALQIVAPDRPDLPAIPVTVSAGVTALQAGNACELADLLAAADSAVYAAKQAGRNQVAFASPLRHLGVGSTRNSADGPAPSTGPITLNGSPLPTMHQVVLLQGEPAQ